MGFLSCLSLKKDTSSYFGGFIEKKYPFFESITHNTEPDFYYELPFDLKFGGILPFPYDTVGTQWYSWVRNPENIRIAFNAFSTVGLNKFVTTNQYFETNNKWNSNTKWGSLTLDSIVKSFIQSDTTSNKEDYFSKFWKRRRLEHNVSEVYSVFVQIDKYYNNPDTSIVYPTSDTVLTHLLKFDTRLITADSSNYKPTALEYFKYLRKVGLEYSAYKLLDHNERIELEQELKDSLINTLQYRIINEDEWLEMDQNSEGWMDWMDYRDPERYYGS